MSACICIGPTTGDHLCPCRRRDEDARQAAKAQGVFSEWNACCYRDECRQRATDYADMQAEFDSCNRLSILRWRVILELQAKLDAVTKDAERYRHLLSFLFEDVESEASVRLFTMLQNAESPDEYSAAIDTALTDQGRAGEGC